MLILVPKSLHAGKSRQFPAGFGKAILTLNFLQSEKEVHLRVHYRYFKPYPPEPSPGPRRISLPSAKATSSF